MSKPTSPAPRSTDSDGSAYNAYDLHRRGDAESRRGTQFETWLRTGWLLDLHGTDDRLGFDGEDGVLDRANGLRIYRQIKKKETGAWTPSGLDSFLRRAFARFHSDSSITHEFYTNAPISRDIVVKRRPNVFELEGHAKRVLELAGDQAAPFAKSVTFYTGLPIEPTDGEAVLAARIGKTVARRFPGKPAIECLKVRDVEDIVSKLFAAEADLSSGEFWDWSDVSKRVPLDQLLDAVENELRCGAAWLAWEEVSAENTGLLSDQQYACLVAISRNEIIRRVAERDIVAQIDAWLTSWPKSNSGGTGGQHCCVLLIAGPRGSGKTWLLTSVGDLLARRIPVLVANESPPQSIPIARMDDQSDSVAAILIDNAEDSWIDILRRPANRLPSRTIFIATVQSGQERSHARGRPTGLSPEVKHLIDDMGQRLRAIPLHASPTHQEAARLARGLRRFPATNSELQELTSVNYRTAVSYLRGEAPERRNAIILAAAQREPAVLESLLPFLFTTAIGVRLPLAVVERGMGQAPHPTVLPWLAISAGAGEFSTYGAVGEVNDILTELLGTALWDQMMETYVSLIKLADPEIPRERQFVRRLVRTILHQDRNLASALLQQTEDAIAEIMHSEPSIAVAFLWLPIVAKLRLLDKEDSTIAAAFLARLSLHDADADDAILLLEALRFAPARERLVTSFESGGSWNAKHVALVARTIRSIPRTEQPRFGHDFSLLFLRLPKAVVADAIRQTEDFQAIIAVLADNGVAEARRVATRVAFESLHQIRAREREIPQNLVESSTKLLSRTISQPRNALSHEIMAELVTRNTDLDLLAKYTECYTDERAVQLKGLIELTMHELKSIADVPYAGQRLSLPSNLLGLTVGFCDQDDRERIVQAFLAAIRSLASRSVPIGVAAPLLLPAFAAISRVEVGKQWEFVDLVYHWLPTTREPSEKMTDQLILRMIRFGLDSPLMTKGPADDVRSVVFQLLTDPSSASQAAERWLNELYRVHFGIGAPQVVVIPDAWGTSQDIGYRAVSLGVVISWSQQECGLIADKVFHNWQAKGGTSYELMQLMVHLGAMQHFETLARDKSLAYHVDVEAFRAVAAAKHGMWRDTDNALRTMQAKWKDDRLGVHPPTARWMHQQLAGMRSGHVRRLHIFAAELSAPRRLRSPEAIESIACQPLLPLATETPHTTTNRPIER